MYAGRISFANRTVRRATLAALFLVTCLESITSATTFTWNTDTNGSWQSSFNWTPFGTPNNTNDAAIFGSVISGPRTIFNSANVTVGALVFDNANAYTISSTGGGQITFDSPGLLPASIDVLSGSHAIENSIALADNLNVNINEGSTLTPAFIFTSLNTPTLTKLGGGDLRINQLASLNNGTLIGKKGIISGIGEISGTLDNGSATVAPGDGDEGTFFVTGNYLQGSLGRLAIELGGTTLAQYDRLKVGGDATLGGLLTVSLSSGFTPSVGNEFSVMTYLNKSGAFNDVTLPTLSSGLQLDTIVTPFDVRVRTGRVVNWTGGGGTKPWNVGGNWQFDSVPDTNSIAKISGIGTTTISNTQVNPILGLHLSDKRHLSLNTTFSPAALNVAGSVVLDPTTTMSLSGSQASLNASTINNQGDIAIGSGSAITASHKYVQTDGSISVRGSLSSEVVQIQAGTLSGDGVVNADLSVGTSGSNAQLRPGFGLGALNVNGDLTLGSNSELFIELDASGQAVVADQIIVADTLTLGGMLNLSLLAGATIPFDNPIQILLADNLSPGALFDDITGLATPDGSLIVTFAPSFPGSFGSVNIHSSQLLGDMNGDNAVDELDAPLFAWAIRDADTYYEEYIIGGGGGDRKLADMDFDGQYTFADIPDFLGAVQIAGGSVAAASAMITHVLTQQVPEPSPLLLLIVGSTIANLASARGGRRA